MKAHSLPSFVWESGLSLSGRCVIIAVLSGLLTNQWKRQSGETLGSYSVVSLPQGLEAFCYTAEFVPYTESRSKKRAILDMNLAPFLIIVSGFVTFLC